MHFYSPARRNVYVELLEEAGTDKSKVGCFLRSMNGCQDAGVSWEFAIRQIMIATGFIQGRKLQEFWVVANRGILGPPGYHDCVKSITWEADPRHAALIRKSFGVTGRSVTTPGVRDKLTDIEGEVPIDKEASDRYRANTMRAQCLSSDRPDIQIECRDLAREMQQPSNLNEMGLKLGVRPRLVWLFKWQKRVTRIESWCDTDHTVYVRTRKSVSGCALMLGGSTVSTYCKGQVVRIRARQKCV